MKFFDVLKNGAASTEEALQAVHAAMTAKLRHRQYIECDQTGYYNKQGKDSSKYRSVDKKLRKHNV